MIINKAVTNMVTESRRLTLTPQEFNARSERAAKSVGNLISHKALEGLNVEMPRSIGPKVSELMKKFPAETFKKIGSKLAELSQSIMEKSEAGYANEAERLFDGKKFRTEIKRIVRNDKQSQEFLKGVKALLEDKTLGRFVENTATALKKQMGFTDSYEAFLYKMGTGGKEWKAEVSKKFIVEKSPIDHLKEFVGYLIKPEKK